MEPALETFLDGLHDDDNVVSLDDIAKRKSPPPPPAKNDNHSGMLDMREMAKRYKEMRETNAPSPVVASGSAPIKEISEVLAQVVVQDEKRVPVRLIAALAAGALLLIVVTALVTATLTARVVKNSSQPSTAAPALVAAQEESTEPAPELSALEPAALEDSSLEEDAPESSEESTPLASEEEPEEELSAKEVQAPVASEPRQAKADQPKESASAKKMPLESATPKPKSEAAVEEAEEKTTEKVEALAATAVEEPAETKEAAAECDEVLCLLEGRGCCGTTPKAVKQASAAQEVDLSLPESLSRREISDALAPVSGRLNSCGLRAGPDGCHHIQAQDLGGRSCTECLIQAQGRILPELHGQGSQESEVPEDPARNHTQLPGHLPIIVGKRFGNEERTSSSLLSAIDAPLAG